jgi:hypothetical protein
MVAVPYSQRYSFPPRPSQVIIHNNPTDKLKNICKQSQHQSIYISHNNFNLTDYGDNTKMTW